MEAWERFDKLSIIITKEALLNEVIHYFSDDQINEFVDSVMKDYDVSEDDLENA